MDWERIESARTRARFLLAIPWLVIAFLVFAGGAAPAFREPTFGGPPPTLLLTISGFQMSSPAGGATGIPIDALMLAVGVFGILIGFAWMWRLYRAPTRVQGAHWRFHDD